MSLVSRLQSLFYPILLLLWLFFIPLAAVIYSAWTYEVHCQWNQRCTQVGLETAQQNSRELASFFRHQAELPSPPWTAKETQHLTEVRGMYDHAFWLFLAITFMFLLDLLISRNLVKYQRYAAISRNILLGLLLLMLAISPFFRYFWMEVFHPLVFSNQLWLTEQGDVSWYLMPRNYFLWVILFILASTFVLAQVMTWLLSKDDA